MEARSIKLHHRTRKKIESIVLKASQEGDLRLKQRLQSILLCDEGFTSGEISKRLQVSRQKASLWLKTFDNKGVEGLLSKPKTGRLSKLSDLQKLLLCDIVESGPLAYGLKTGIWTSPIIRDIISDEFGVSYHDGHVRKLLKEFGFSVQRPKFLLARADAEKKANWVRKIYPKIKKKHIKINRP